MARLGTQGGVLAWERCPTVPTIAECKSGNTIDHSRYGSSASTTTCKCLHHSTYIHWMRKYHSFPATFQKSWTKITKKKTELTSRAIKKNLVNLDISYITLAFVNLPDLEPNICLSSCFHNHHTFYVLMLSYVCKKLFSLSRVNG